MIPKGGRKPIRGCPNWTCDNQKKRDGAEKEDLSIRMPKDHITSRPGEQILIVKGGGPSKCLGERGFVEEQDI